MNCSATLCRMVMLGLIAMSLLGQTAQAETQAELDNTAARMQYAYYTGDIRALEELVRLAEAMDAEPGLAAPKAYHLAYANWKLAQLYAVSASGEPARPNAKSLGTRAAQSCVRHAQAAVAGRFAMAEAYAIEAA